MRRYKRHRRGRGLGIILLMVMSIFITIRYARTRLDEERTDLKAQVEQLSTSISQEKERTEEIKDLKAYVQTKKYVEDMAREKFGLVYPDEVIIQAEK